MKELSEALKSKKIIIGLDRTLKLLKNDNLKNIFVSNNCKKEIKDDIEHYANINKVKVIELDMDNEELGAFCKKPFSISVLSLRK